MAAGRLRSLSSRLNWLFPSAVNHKQLDLLGQFQLAFLHEKVDKAMLELIQNSFWLRCLKLHGSTAGVDRIHSGLWVAEGRA